MTDNGNRYALAALKNKRAALASEIIQLERQLRHRRDMLVHVDATLRIFDPDVDVSAIPNKRQRVMLFRQGELTRAVFDAMRASDGPVSCSDIVQAVMDAQSLGTEARSALFAKVRGTLAYQHRQGKVAKTGDQKTARWTISP